MLKLARFLFFAIFARLLVLFLLGLNVRHRERLPATGPAIVAANHNSHLDTLVLISVLPIGLLPRIRPVAAADYFLGNRLLAWFARNIIGIIPLDRAPKRGRDPLLPCVEALQRDEILILFPEGSRGEPEVLAKFKSGIAHLSERFPDVAVIPVFIHGLGKALPKGEAILVPFFCDVFVGNGFVWPGSRADFMSGLDQAMTSLAAEETLPEWE